MHVAVVENCLEDKENIRNILQQYPVITVDYFSTSESLLKSNIEYHAVLTAIDVPIENGLRMSKKLRDRGYDNPIVILSWHHGFEHESFAIHPFSFIKKENLLYELPICLIDLIHHYEIKQQRFIYTDTKGQQQSILCDRISYFQRKKNGVYIHIAGFSIGTIKCSLQDIINKNLLGFYRINKSEIINMHHVQEYQFKDRTFIMDHGETLEISRRKQLEIKNACLKYIAGK